MTLYQVIFEQQVLVARLLKNLLTTLIACYIVLHKNYQKMEPISQANFRLGS